MMNLRFGWMLLVALLGFSGIALADPDPAAAVPVPDKGDTAWMMLSTLLVILMIIPGLALFYGGLVRAKNMLSVLAQVFTIFCVIAILWVVYGYSLAFTDGGSLNSFVGGLSKMFLKGVVVNVRKIDIVELHAAQLLELFLDAAAHFKRKF